MGAASARHSPCPLLEEGTTSSKTRTREMRREIANACDAAELKNE